MITIVRCGCPDDVNAYYYTDDSQIIFKVHQSGFQPMWKDENCVYFKKTNKLIKLLKKLDIDIEVN